MSPCNRWLPRKRCRKGLRYNRYGYWRQRVLPYILDIYPDMREKSSPIPTYAHLHAISIQIKLKWHVFHATKESVGPNQSLTLITWKGFISVKDMSFEFYLDANSTYMGLSGNMNTSLTHVRQYWPKLYQNSGYFMLLPYPYVLYLRQRVQVFNYIESLSVSNLNG